MRLFVFATARKTRAFYEEALKKDALLDKALSISDFLDSVCLCEGFKASSYESLLLMQKACVKSKNLEQKLGISSEFFAFLKNKDYLFSFFKELAIEHKDLNVLKNNDYYATYNEHLDILNEVLTNYLALLKEASLYDELSLPQNYSLNLDFLNNFDEIIYDLEGFLSAFETRLLTQISSKKNCVLRFKTSKFNLEALLSLPFLKDLSLKENFYYEFNLSQNKILKSTELKRQNSQIFIKSFKLRILQAAFVFDKISQFIREGLEPEKIAVITPDEDFCEFLRLLDKNNSLNYASGISIRQSEFYQRLNALYESANLEDFVLNEDKDYFDKNDQIFDYENSMLHFYELDFKDFKAKFDAPCDLAYFKDLINLFLSLEKSSFANELRALIEEQMLFISNLLKFQSLKLRELLELFFIQLAPLKLSSVGGGKVYAMGLLESRGLSFDGVIIVDFNDDLIPTRSVNELFLNNDLRKKAGLISYEKRESLQRFYYQSLINSAKKVALCFVENEEKIRSRLLNELDFSLVDEPYKEEAYAKALKFTKQVHINLSPLNAPKFKYNLFERPLSFSRLNLFLKHKRSYFYKYILKLNEPRALSFEESKEKNTGLSLHEFLSEFFDTHKEGFNEKEFFDFFDKKSKKLSALEAEIWLLRLKGFVKAQKEHFDKGHRVLYTEKELEKELIIDGKGIKIQGKIDRIDALNDTYMIFDYKTGKLDERSFQLAFYQALFDEKARAVFLNLKTNELVNINKNYDLEHLKECLKELLIESEDEIEFENEKENLHCPYKLIYEKDLK